MHPILFSLGRVHIFSYGVLVALGVLSTVFLFRANCKQISVNPETVVDLIITTVISGFTGARIAYILQYWNYFKAAPLDMLKLWEGGIILYGGLIGGVIGFSIFIRLRRLPFLPLLDLFVIGMALAQGFGRIGCFLNGCCYGSPTHVPWAVSFPFLGEPVHPTQLYEAAFCFSLAGYLLYLWRKRLTAGIVALNYFILYPLGRFVFEFFRGDNARIFLNLTLQQWISLALIAVTLYSFTIIRSRHGRKATDRPS